MTHGTSTASRVMIPRRHSAFSAALICIIAVACTPPSSLHPQDTPHVAWKPPGRSSHLSKVSPDGRYISYEKWEPGDDLFLHDLATGADRRLTKAVGKRESAVGSSAFSRQSTRLAYGWNNNEGFCELRVIDLQDPGIPQPRRLFVEKNVDRVHPLDWAPDDRVIAVDVVRHDGSEQIALISVGDGSLRPLQSSPVRLRVSAMSFSPDGQYLAFDSRPGNQSATEMPRDISVLALDRREGIPAAVNFTHGALVGWSADGTRLVFTSGRNGSNGLFAVRIGDGRPQGEPELIRPDVGPLSSLGLTTSGSLFYFEEDQTTSVVKTGSFDFSTGQMLKPPSDLLLEYSDASNKSPKWSPDGKSLAYIVEHSSRAGDSRLAVNMLETDQVQEFPAHLARMDWLYWAPDARSLMVSASDVNGEPGLWRVDVATHETSPIARGSFGRDIYPTYAWPSDGNLFYGWSRDARKIYYQRESGRVLVERDLASGLDQELFRQTGSGPWFPPRLSAGLAKLYYRRGQGPASEAAASQAVLIERDLASGVERELMRGNLGGPAVSPDGRLLATTMFDVRSRSESYVLVPVAGGEPRPLMQVTLDQSIKDGHSTPNLDAYVLWAPDSRSLLFFAFDADSTHGGFWWIPMNGGEPAKITGSFDSDSGELIDFRVHPDGRQFAIMFTSQSAAVVWVLKDVLPKGSPK